MDPELEDDPRRHVAAHLPQRDLRGAAAASSSSPATPTSGPGPAICPHNFEPIAAADRWRLLEGDGEVLPGISVRLTPGHVPWHQAVLVRDRGETAVFLADLIPTTAHLPLPWIMGYDLEPLRTLESKRALLDDAVRGGLAARVRARSGGGAWGGRWRRGRDIVLRDVIAAPRRPYVTLSERAARRSLRSVDTPPGSPLACPPRQAGRRLPHPQPAGPMPQRNRVLASQPIGGHRAAAALGVAGTRVIDGCPFFFFAWRHATVHERSRKANPRQPHDPHQSGAGHRPRGEQLGVLPVEEALAAAQERGLDLVEVAPTARPPVVKIMDYGKFKFEEAKAARAAKKKQHVIQLKEVKYRPGIDDHDFDFKTRHAREFLGDGNKVKVTMMFRGRQIAHLELGKAVLDRVAASLADIGKIEADAKLEGRNMTMVLAPK